MAVIRRDEDGKIIEIIEKTKSHQEQAQESAQKGDSQAQAVAFMHEKDIDPGGKVPNVDSFPFAISATDRNLAWSTYTAERQVAAETDIDSQE